eukprot:jgi/Tetstr1/439482/TSEL_027914.t1
MSGMLSILMSVAVGRSKTLRSGSNDEEAVDLAVDSPLSPGRGAGWKEQHLEAPTECPSSDDSDDCEDPEAGFPATASCSVRCKYRLGRRLGDGASCVVRLATERASGRRWACKAVRLPALDAAGRETAVPQWMPTRAEARAEAELGRRLRGLPGLLSCREWFEEGDTLYLILPLLEGGDMGGLLEEVGNLTEIEAATAAVALLRALAALHKAGVAHRDLKLDNLLLARPGDHSSLTIGDLGMARAASPLDPLRTVCGSVHYLAPEVLAQAAPYGCGCDVWAAGVCLFAMLAGYLPFDDDNLPSLFAAIGSGEADFDDPAWALISPGAADLVRCLLTVDPAERPSAEEALAHPWLAAAVAAKAKSANAPFVTTQ